MDMVFIQKQLLKYLRPHTSHLLQTYNSLLLLSFPVLGLARLAEPVGRGQSGYTGQQKHCSTLQSFFPLTHWKKIPCADCPYNYCLCKCMPFQMCDLLYVCSACTVHYRFICCLLTSITELEISRPQPVPTLLLQIHKYSGQSVVAVDYIRVGLRREHSIHFQNWMFWRKYSPDKFTRTRSRQHERKEAHAGSVWCQPISKVQDE